MLLTDLIKQLKREYKSGGEIEVTAISITPDGKVIISGNFESGPVRAEPRAPAKSVAVFDEHEPSPKSERLTRPK